MRPPRGRPGGRRIRGLATASCLPHPEIRPGGRHQRVAGQRRPGAIDGCRGGRDHPPRLHSFKHQCERWGANPRLLYPRWPSSLCDPLAWRLRFRRPTVPNQRAAGRAVGPGRTVRSARGAATRPDGAEQRHPEEAAGHLVVVVGLARRQHGADGQAAGRSQQSLNGISNKKPTASPSRLANRGWATVLTYLARGVANARGRLSGRAEASSAWTGRSRGRSRCCRERPRPGA